MENSTTGIESEIQKNVKSLFPNAILVNRPNSNYPFIIASNYSENKDKIEYYLSTHMQHSKTELEAWQNAEKWINNTLGNTDLYKSLVILELSKEQQMEHLDRLNQKMETALEQIESFKFGNDGPTKEQETLHKDLLTNIDALSYSLSQTDQIINKSNIVYEKITLKDLEKLPAAILLDVGSELYTFDPNKKMNNLSDENFNKLLKLKETKNDIVLIHFKTDHIAMTQSITTEDLKPVYLNDLKLLSDKQTGVYLSQYFPGTTDDFRTNKFSEWLKQDSDNDGLTNGEELYRGTDPYSSDTDGDGIIDGVEVAQNTNPLEVNINKNDETSASLPQGTTYRIIPSIIEDKTTYQIQKKHSIFGWRNNKTSAELPKMNFEDKTEALNVFNKMQNAEIKKSKGFKL